MARRSGLGKGLGALIPGDEQAEPTAITGGVDAEPVLREIPLSAVSPNRYQPRSEFDEESLQSLASSIRELGVLQPILVRPDEAGSFELIAGERRWRAAQLAGLETIPALVRVAEQQTSLEHALVENLHRSDLNSLEEAAAYQQLIDEFGLTQDAVAKRVGKSRSAITNLLRLFQLPQAVQKLVADGALSAGHARALLALSDPDRQASLAKEIVAGEWSVREIESRIRAELGRPPPKPTSRKKASPAGAPEPGSPRPPALVELEELLADHLDTRVSVTMGDKRGRVIIDFADLDDLERVYRAMIEGRGGEDTTNS